MSGAPEAASRKGGLDLPPWLGCKGRKKAEGAGPGTERLAETDRGNPETADGRDTVRKRETREVEEDRSWSESGRPLRQTIGREGLTPRQADSQAGRACAREQEEATGE